MTTRPDDVLLQSQEVGELLHIGPAAVRYLASKHADFPAPAKTVHVRGATVRVWWQTDIETWAAPHGYLGRGAAAVAAAAQEASAQRSAGRRGPKYVTAARSPRHYAHRAG